jgi:hypothetical protein
MLVGWGGCQAGRIPSQHVALVLAQAVLAHVRFDCATL